MPKYDAIPLTPAPIRHIVVMKTTTAVKTIHYETIARFLNLPIHFITLTDVMEGFIAADEDTADQMKNLLQKMDDPENISAHLRDPKSPLRRVLRGRLKQFGIDDKDVEYHWAAEDSIISTGRKEWEKLHDVISPYVPEKLLQGIARNGNKAGPAAETGHILANVGIYALMEYLREVTLTTATGTQRPKLTSVVNFSLNSMSANPQQPIKTFEAETTYDAYMPDGVDKPIPVPDTPLPETEDFIAQHDQPLQPQSAAYRNWLVNVSPRSAIVRQLAKHLEIRPEGAERLKSFVEASRHTFVRRIEVLQDPVIYSFGDSGERIGRFRILPSGADTVEQASLNIEPILERADAIIIRGLKGLDENERKLRLLQLFAVLVDKQTRARAKHRPIILVDDGSLKEVVDYCARLYQRGLVKNYVNRPIFMGLDKIVSDPAVKLFSDGYMDVISAGGDGALSDAQIRTAINQILTARLETYAPFVSPTPPHTLPLIGGTPQEPGAVTVTFYTSASNNNRIVIDNSYAYGQFLAKNGFDACYGGGDLMYAMGAFSNGYRDAKGGHLIAISTFDLLINETSNGHVPSYVQEYEVYPDITQRRDRLFQRGNIEVVAWGGYGTQEEDMNGEAWRVVMPDIALDKYKLFFAPGMQRGDDAANINEAIMRVRHGNAFVDSILANPRAFLDQGYALATTLEDAKELTLEMRERVLAQRLEAAKRPRYGATRSPAARAKGHTIDD